MSLPGIVEDTSATDLINIDQFILDHPAQHRVAKWVSDWMSPPVFGAAIMLIIGLALRTAVVWLWGGAFVVMCVGVPTGYVFWLARTGRVSDFHIPIRSQRIKPMILMLVMTLLSALLLVRLHPPVMLLGIAILGVFMMGFMFLVTLRWKISGHATAVTAFSSLCTLLFGGLGGFTFLLVPLVIWARLRLRRHTVRQTIAGMALGLTTFTLIFLK
jgi:membrane-associated phospholipid phosphatase